MIITDPSLSVCLPVWWWQEDVSLLLSRSQVGLIAQLFQVPPYLSTATMADLLTHANTRTGITTQAKSGVEAANDYVHLSCLLPSLMVHRRLGVCYRGATIRTPTTISSSRRPRRPSSRGRARWWPRR